MRGILFSILAGAAALAATSAAGQPSEAAAVKSVTLAKVFINMPAGTVYADLKAGMFCNNPKRTVYNGGRNEQKITAYLPPFQEAMEKAGYKAGGDNLFQTNSDPAEFEAAAVITDELIDACLPQVGKVDAKGQMTMKIDWQIYSRLRQQVVGRYSTTGTFALHDPKPGGLQLLIAGSFGDNARQLAALPELRTLLAQQNPAAGSVLTSGAGPRISLAGSTAAPTRDVSEAAGDVLVVLSGQESGSGVLMSQDGYVLTDAHVVGASKEVKLRWSDGLETAGEVVRVNTTRDVALIKTDPRGRIPLPLKRGTVTQGQQVFAIGAPLGAKFQGSVSRGVVSASRVFDGMSFIQSDVSVAPGSSGGPLLDDGGHVIGLAVGQFRMANAPIGLNMFIPIGDALDFLSLDAR